MTDVEKLTSVTPATTTSASVPFPIGSRQREQDGMAPLMPPPMASVKSHTADEIVQMMNKTPLFMTSLESEGNEGMLQWGYNSRSKMFIS